MMTKFNNAERGMGNLRKRNRLRAAIPNSKTGMAIGFTSIAAPIIGYIVNDLRKPDSLIRALIGKVTKTFLERKTGKTEMIDITDKVAIIEVDKRKKVNNRKKLKACFPDPGVCVMSIGEARGRLAL